MSTWFRVTACALLLLSAPALAKRPASAPSRSRQAARARAAAPPPAKRTPAPSLVPDMLAFPGSGLLDPDGYARVWPGLLEGKVVVLDPGHGGSASGAVATRGLRESDLNLWVARELKEFLGAAGATVVMTRVGDTDCLIAKPFVLRDDLVARAQVSNHLEADLFLSCHHNDAPVRMSSSALQRFNRTEIYYRMDDEGPSRTLGTQIFGTLWPLLSNTRSQLIPGAFAVLRFNDRPAVLGEPFYISAGLSEKVARMGRFPAAEATRYLEGMLGYLRRAYDPPRVVRPIEGEVVDRETFPLWIAVPPVRPEPPRPVPSTPVTTASTAPAPITTASTAPAVATTSVAAAPPATASVAPSPDTSGWHVPSAAEAAASVPTAGAAAASLPSAGLTTAPHIAAPAIPWYWHPIASVEPTLVVTVAGRPLPVTFDPVKRRAWAQLKGIPNGPVLIEATLVGPDGRHSPVTRRHFVFEMPAATIRAHLSPAFVDAGYRGPSILTATLADARGMPIADGTPVPVLHQGREIGRPRSRGGVIQLTLDSTPPAVPSTAVVATRVTTSTTATPVVTAPPVPDVIGPPVAPPVPTRAAKKPAPKPRPSPVVPTTPAAFIPGTDPTLPANLPSMPAAPGTTSTLMPSVVFGLPAAPLPALVPPGPITLAVSTASVTATVSSSPSATTTTAWLAGRAFDARTGLAIEKLSMASSAGTTIALDAHAGHFVLHATAPATASLDLVADGYIAQTITGLALTPAGGRRDVPVTPVLYGTLHQHSIVFDADPGSQTGAFLSDAVAMFGGTGVDGAWGTWDGAGDRTEQERARAANRTPAEFAITVMDNIGGFLGGPVTVHHYHASERGRAIANAIADAFRRYYPPVSASRKSGGSYFLNNTRATTLGLSFASSRGSGGLRHDRVAYIVMHGLMRALRPELPKGRTISGKAPAGVPPGSWMILGNGDRCRLDPAGQYTFLDVPPGRYAVWFQAETPDRRPTNRATFWIDVP